MTPGVILNSKKGLVVAPAGCGKTQLIVDILKTPTEKPYLVLTHTTAGVAALRQRLMKARISKSNYHITTIAGWALDVASKFPIRSNFKIDILSLSYPELHNSISTLCKEGHINDVISASYSRLFVDEYQDCSISQHSLICAMSTCLPTVVFGDPLQAIFDFDKKDPLPDWESDIVRFFPKICHLDIPWRWLNSGNKDLGNWLLRIRSAISKRQSINLKNADIGINWKPLSGNQQNDFQLQIDTCNHLRKNMLPTESLLIVGNSKAAEERYKFAIKINGIGVVEPVRFKDIIYLARKIDSKNTDTHDCVLITASTMMTNVESFKLPDKANLVADSMQQMAIKLLTKLEQKSECRIFRQVAFSVLKDALLHSINNPGKSVTDSISIIIQKRQHKGDKKIPNHAIGSTLLLKGLEADHVMILDASPEQMNPNHLYVALSRGAKSITIFSLNAIV